MAQSVAVLAVETIFESVDFVASRGWKQKRHACVDERGERSGCKLPGDTEGDPEVFGVRFVVGVGMSSKRVLSHA